VLDVLTRDVPGTVQTRFSKEGPGVLVSPELDGTAFAHFAIVGPGDADRLQDGQAVTFRYVTSGQDGLRSPSNVPKALP
jgi:cold shock CspA family protein